jgi:hypothetical protein
VPATAFIVIVIDLKKLLTHTAGEQEKIFGNDPALFYLFAVEYLLIFRYSQYPVKSGDVDINLPGAPITEVCLPSHACRIPVSAPGLN